jgi:hypothetical protein
VAGKQPGDTIELEIRRGGETRTVEVELGERPDQLGGSPGSQEKEQEPLFPLP